MGRRRAMAILGAAILIASGASACSRTASPAAASRTCIGMSPSPGATATGPVQAPGAGGVKVVEEGFSQNPDPRGLAVSIGAMVQNASDLVAYGTTATFRLLDAKGADIGDPEDGLWRVVRIPVIMPGDRVPVGTNLGVDVRREIALGFVPRVASVEITLKVAQWWAPDNSVIKFSAVRTTGVVLDPPPITVTFSTVSPYCDSLAGRGAAVVYRDRTGRIFGGGTQPVVTDIYGPSFCPAGTFEKWRIGTLVVGANKDWLPSAASVDAAAYCDFVRRDGTFVETAPRAFRSDFPQSPQSIN